MNELLDQLMRPFQQYFTQHICMTMHSFQKSTKVAIVLMLIHLYWKLSLLISTESIIKLKAVDFNIPQLTDGSLLAGFSHSSYVCYGGVILNFCLFSLLLLDALVTSHQNLGRSNLKPRLFQSVSSFIIQIYNYVCFIPFVYHAMQSFSNEPVSYVLIVTTILLSLLICFYDQNFAYNSDDLLSNRIPFIFQACDRLLEIACCFVIVFTTQVYVLLICVSAVGAFTCLHLILRSYMNSELSLTLHLSFSLFLTMISAASFIAIIMDTQFSVTFLFLLLIPLSFTLAYLITIQKRSMWTLMYDKPLYSPQNDYLIRLLIKESRLEFEDYKVRPESLYIDLIAVNHLVSCESYPKCFCNVPEIKKFSQYQDSVMLSKQRKKFLNGFLYRLFLGFCSESTHKLSDSHFSFINYLIEIKKSKVQAFCEIIKLNSKGLLSSKEKPLLYEMFCKARHQFDDQIGIYSSRAFKRGSNYLKGVVDAPDNLHAGGNSSNKNTQKENMEQKDFFSGIKFDEELNELEKIYFAALQEKEGIVKMLCNDFIDLVALRVKGISYIEARLRTQLKLQHLCLIHYNSQKLQYYIERFIILMSFGQKKRALFRPNLEEMRKVKAKESDDGLERAKNTNQPGLNGYGRIDQTIFEKDNCVVFITLIEPVGRIRRVQNKFENMFGYPGKEILGMNITTIIPTSIALRHDLLLRGYVEEQTSVADNQPGQQLYKSMPLILAKNQKGWAVPVSLQFKADYIGLDDFGLSGHLCKIKTDSVFIMTSTKYFQTQIVSQVLYDKLLSAFCENTAEVNKIFLNRMIPLLPFFEKMWLKDEEQQGNLDDPSNNSKANAMIHKQVIRTIAFLPKLDQQESPNQAGEKNVFSLYKLAGQQVMSKRKQFFFKVMEYGSLEKELKKYSVDNLDMYQVKIQVQLRKSKYFSYNLVEIKSMRKITDYHEMKSSVMFFTQQMKTLLNVSYPQTAELDRIDMLIEAPIGTDQQSMPFELVVNHDKKLADLLVGDPQENDLFSNYQVRSPSLDQHSHFRQLSLDPNHENGPSSTVSNKELIPVGKRYEAQKSLFKLMQDQVFDEKSDRGRQIRPQVARELSETNDFKLTHMEERNRNIHNQQDETAEILLNATGDTSMIQKLNVSQVPSQINHSALDLSQRDVRQYYQSHSNITKPINTADDKLNQAGGGGQDPMLRSFTSQDNNNYLTPLTTDRQTNNPLYINGPNNNNSAIENILFQGNAQDLTDRGISTTNRFQSDNLIKPQLLEEPIPQRSPEKKLSFFQQLRENLRRKIQETSKNIEKQSSEMPQSETHILEDNGMFSSNNTKTLDSRFTRIMSQKTSMTRLADLYQTVGSKKQILSKSQAQLNSEALIFNYVGDGERSELENEGNDILKKKHGAHTINVQNQKDVKSHSASDNDYFQDDEETQMRRSKLMAQATSSIHTSKSANYDQRRTLKYQINSKKKSFLMLMLTLFGFLAFSVIFVLTLVQYFNIVSQFNLASRYFSFVPWPMSIRSNYVMTMTEDASLSLIENSAFTGIADNNFEATQVKYFDSAVSSFFDLYNAFEQSDQTQLEFFQALNDKIQMILSIDDAVSIDPFSYNESEKKYRSFSVAYFIQLISSYLYQMKNDLTHKTIYQKIQTDNFQTFNTRLLLIQSLIQDQTISLINSIQSEVLLMLILVIVVSILLIFAIFPLYSFVQIKNENLLKLFATIQPDHLKAMLLPLQMAINEGKSTRLKYFTPELAKKKKTISATGTLPKFKPLFLAFSLFSFGLIIIQPIANYALVNSFRSESVKNISLLINLYDLKATFISSMAINLQYVFHLMFPSIGIYNFSYYVERASQILSANQAKLSTMYNTIQTGESASRFQQSYYDNFLFKIFDSNMCIAFEDYPQFVPSTTQLSTYSICSAIFDGSFQQGFQFSVKQFTQIFIEWNSYYADTTTFTAKITQWEALNNYQDFDYFFRQLVNSIDIMKDFMLTMLNDQLDYNKIVQTVLLFFQLLALSIIFLAGWLQFYFYVQNEMFRIKGLLSVLNMEVVLDNPYIISYLSQ